MIFFRTLKVNFWDHKLWEETLIRGAGRPGRVSGGSGGNVWNPRLGIWLEGSRRDRRDRRERGREGELRPQLLGRLLWSKEPE